MKKSSASKGTSCKSMKTKIVNPKPAKASGITANKTKAIVRKTIAKAKKGY